MTQNIRRTAQGQQIDMGALILKNEHVRAVGNMSVNARGDVIDAWDRPVDPKTAQLERQRRREQSNVRNEPVQTKIAKTQAPQTKAVIPVPPEDFDDEFDKSKLEAAPVKINSLAEAIAKARQIQQTVVTPTNNTGINKI
jgi:hypothetical protein